ncbi:MAG: hypothetical protein ABSE80_13445, partial [Halobacteriota archaeon]
SSGEFYHITNKEGRKEIMKHWTQANTSDFAYGISLDFFTQLDAVSQTLNNPPENPHLETLVQYARPLGRKVAIVLYDDNDPDNDKGPIYSGIFEKAWRALGCPRDLGGMYE